MDIMQNLKQIALASVLALERYGRGAGGNPQKPAPNAQANTNVALKSPEVIPYGIWPAARSSFTRDQAVERFTKAGYSRIATPMLDKDAGDCGEE
jgi:hypothetical protein